MKYYLNIEGKVVPYHLGTTNDHPKSIDYRPALMIALNALFILIVMSHA